MARTISQTGIHLSNETKDIISQYLQYGNLAERITLALGDNFTQKQLHLVYNSLCHCLEDNKMFIPSVSSTSNNVKTTAQVID